MYAVTAVHAAPLPYVPLLNVTLAGATHAVAGTDDDDDDSATFTVAPVSTDALLSVRVIDQVSSTACADWTAIVWTADILEAYDADRVIDPAANTMLAAVTEEVSVQPIP